jgi:mono/diheme cytochrome c family protein
LNDVPFVSVLPPQQGEISGEKDMGKQMRNVGTAMLVVLLAGSVSFAQSSAEALYKAKCQMCHGEKGLADSPVGKSMKVKPATEPDVKKMSEAEMAEAVKNGMGKMQPYKDKLSDAQIKDVVTYFRTFAK